VTARLLVVAAVVAIAVVLAVVARRRRPDVPTQPARNVPQQLDRADFPRPQAPWLVVVFTSSTCHTCADVAAKAAVLSSDDVEVTEVEFGAQRRIHDRYRIDAVPTVVLADAEGVVRASLLGPVTATDLWAAIAAAREES